MNKEQIERDFREWFVFDSIHRSVLDNLKKCWFAAAKKYRHETCLELLDAQSIINSNGPAIYQHQVIEKLQQQIKDYRGILLGVKEHMTPLNTYGEYSMAQIEDLLKKYNKENKDEKEKL